MAFVNWQALYEAMLDKIASRDADVGQVSAGGKTIIYKSNKEFIEWFNFVEAKAKAESGDAVPRTYAGQGGRGI